MPMNKVQARLLLRNIVRDELGLTVTDDDVNFSTESLNLYLDLGLTHAGKKEIEADTTRRVVSDDLDGVLAGDELLDPPGDFFRVVEIRYDEDTAYSYRKYNRIHQSVRSNWSIHTNTGLAYYIQGNQIGILPALALGEKAILIYYKKPTVWNDTTETDLTDEGCLVAVLYAADMALASRGDNNVMAIKQRLAEAEDNLYTIRQEDDNAEACEPDTEPSGGLTPFNITVTP